MEYIQDKLAFYRYLYNHCSCINAIQSQEKRRFKYAIARYLGKSRKWANTLRDWRDNNFAKYFGYNSWQDLMNVIQGVAYKK